MVCQAVLFCQVAGGVDGKEIMLSGGVLLDKINFSKIKNQKAFFMSRWEEQLNSHQIHESLRELHGWASKDFDNADDNQLIEKRRFLKIIEAIQEILKNLDPELVPYSVLDNINNNLRSENVWNQVAAYRDSGGFKNLRRANDHITTLLGQFADLISIAKKTVVEKPIQGLEKQFDNFVSSVAAERSKLKEEFQKLSDLIQQQRIKIDELSAEIEAKKKETNDLIANWQGQFSAAQDKRQTDFSESQKQQTAELNQWRKQIETDAQKSIQDITAKSTDKLTAHQVDFDQKITSFLNEAKEKHQAILELYELTAGDSVASAYIKNADDEKDEANFWRWMTIAFVVATAVWTGISYYIGNTVSPQGEILWTQILKALSVTGVLLFGAGYSAKQSNAHRQNEKRTRWFALEVKAIDPFIASLDPNDQKSLKNKLSERLFGQQNHPDEKDIVATDDHLLEVIFKGIVDVIKAK